MEIRAGVGRGSSGFGNPGRREGGWGEDGVVGWEIWVGGGEKHLAIHWGVWIFQE